jgi:hypothetical protein
MAETWTVSPDQTSATVTGRALVSIWKKLNPIWWFGNDTEQTLAQVPTYLPTWPQWMRVIAWNLRNPLQNFRCFVVGVQDRNYTVTGKAPVQAVQRNDISPTTTGWQWCVLHLAVPLFFVSYSGTYVVWYIGWQPSGFFGIKFNLANSPIQAV